MSSTIPPLPELKGSIVVDGERYTFDAIELLGTELRAYGKACAATEREAWNDAISDALQSDMENGVKWLNEHAARDFEAKYPALAAVIRARGET